MAKLESAQVAVLKAVADGPKPTSNVTNAHTVSGTCAKGLEGKGLVKRSVKKGVTHVAITAAGKKALKAA